MGRIVFFFLFLFLPLVGMTNEAYLGEVKRTEYTGPHLPIYKIDHYLKQVVSEDEYYNQWYFQSKIQKEFFDLNHFLNGEFLTGHYCPDEIFKQYHGLYRYLIRLLAVSYLHNSIKDYEYTAMQMGDHHLCRPDWKSVFESCRPKTQDMQTFIKNIKFILPNIKPVIVPFDKTKQKVISHWIKQLNRGQVESLSQARLLAYCKEKKCSDPRTKKAVKEGLRNICAEDIETIRHICSEEDSFFGLSYAPEVYPLILRSNALRVVKPARYRSGCLRRFIQDNKKRELTSYPLKKIFTYLYSQYMREEVSYEQGRIFIGGALKEFTDKGLVNLFSEQEETKKVIIKKKKKSNPKPKVAKLNLSKKEKKVKKKVANLIPKKDPIKKKYTNFYSAAEFRRKNKLEKVDLDMIAFKYDFVFTLDQKRKFLPVLKKFSSHESLRKMKEVDGLGQKKAPIPLKFLKLLIDEEMHQDLFNITFVLGNQFFVLNDIDEGKQVEKVEFKNDKSTQFKWLISLVGP